MEIAADFFVSRVHPHGHVSGGHHDMGLACAIGGGRHIIFLQVFWLPLIGTRGRLGQLPLIAEQNTEIGHVPSGRGRRPCAFNS